MPCITRQQIRAHQQQANGAATAGDRGQAIQTIGHAFMYSRALHARVINTDFRIFDRHRSRCFAAQMLARAIGVIVD
jgi:hypothetical protein